MKMAQKFKRHIGGASLAEYALLVGLLGTMTLFTVSQVGGSARNSLEHSEHVIAENVGSKKGHEPGNGAPGNGGPGNGVPGNGDGNDQTGPAARLVADQNFGFDGYAFPGEPVGTVVVEGGTPKGFELISGGEGLTIDNSGRITVVDPAQFGPVEATKSVTVRVVSERGPTTQGVIQVRRSTPVDLANDATTKGRLVVGTPVRSEFGQGDLGDWIAVETAVAGDLHVLARGDAHSGTAMTHPIVTLRDSGGKLLATSSVDFSSHAAVLYNDLPAGKYFIQITKFASGAAGGYSVETAFVDDAGDSISMAGEIAFGTTIQSSIIYGDEADWWKVEVPVDGHIRFMADSTYGGNSPHTVNLSVHGSNGESITNAIGTSFGAVIVNDVKAGTYYARVLGPNGKDHFKYGLSVTGPHKDDRSDTKTEATLKLAEDGDIPERKQGSHIIGDTGDWYRFEVDERTNVQVDIKKEAGDDFSFSAGLRNSTGGVITSKVGSANTFLYHDLSPGTYFIAVQSLGGSRQESQYSIGIRKIIDAPDTLIAAKQARPYGFGSVRGRLDRNDSADFYRFSATWTGPHMLKAHDLGIGSIMARVVDANGKILADPWPSRSATVSLVEGQEYFVQIFGGHVGDYGFSFSPETNWSGSFPEFVLEGERSAFH